MQNKTLITLSAALFTAGPAPKRIPAPAPAPAQPAAQPNVRDHQGRGHHNVYIFRYKNHQGMLHRYARRRHRQRSDRYGRPPAAKTYLDEIRKIAEAPIKLLVYRHHHYDHIAGGKVFQDAGATVISIAAPRNGSSN